MISLNIHDIVKIKVEKKHQLDTGAFHYTIILRDEHKEIGSLVLYSKEPLEIIIPDEWIDY